MEAAQPRCKRGRRPLGWMQRRAAIRAIIQHMSGCIIFVRKALLIKYSYAFPVILSGVGTLDELFEAPRFDSEREDQTFSDCDRGNRLLAATDRFHRTDGAARENQSLGFTADFRDGSC